MKKFEGVFPAFYASYDKEGEVSEKGTRALTRHLIDKGVNGLYVCGSSGECIYQSVDERKRILEWVMDEAYGKLTIIAHVASNNTKDSMNLAMHAESLKVDAISAIPPIYFKLPENAIAKYWNDISSAAPNTPFFVYNIPQLAGVTLTKGLFREMRKNPNVLGVKNSSLPSMDIEIFHEIGGNKTIVFNGPDEQFVAGLAMGAIGGIGGTYAVMPELYLKAYELFKGGKTERLPEIQRDINRIIFTIIGAKGSLYAVLKEILRLRENIDCGSVRAPLMPLDSTDMVIVREAVELIDKAIGKWSK